MWENSNLSRFVLTTPFPLQNDLRPRPLAQAAGYPQVATDTHACYECVLHSCEARISGSHISPSKNSLIGIQRGTELKGTPVTQKNKQIQGTLEHEVGEPGCKLSSTNLLAT